jgi:hypothetical protein
MHGYFTRKKYLRCLAEKNKFPSKNNSSNPPPPPKKKIPTNGPSLINLEVNQQ